MDKGGLGSFGLSNPFQADAAAGSQLEPDFDHLDGPKLVKQLPRGHAFIPLRFRQDLPWTAGGAGQPGSDGASTIG